MIDARLAWQNQEVSEEKIEERMSEIESRMVVLERSEKILQAVGSSEGCAVLVAIQWMDDPAAVRAGDLRRARPGVVDLLIAALLIAMGSLWGHIGDPQRSSRAQLLWLAVGSCCAALWMAAQVWVEHHFRKRSAAIRKEITPRLDALERELAAFER